MKNFFGEIEVLLKYQKSTSDYVINSASNSFNMVIIEFSSLKYVGRSFGYFTSATQFDA